MKYRIKDLREDNDLTQKQIAKEINVHQTTYSDYELENIQTPVDVNQHLFFFGGATEKRG